MKTTEELKDDAVRAVTAYLESAGGKVASCTPINVNGETQLILFGEEKRVLSLVGMWLGA